MNKIYLNLIAAGLASTVIVGCNNGHTPNQSSNTGNTNISESANRPLKLQSAASSRRVKMVFRNGTNHPVKIKAEDMDCIEDWGDVSGSIIQPGQSHDFTVKSEVGEDIGGLIPNITSSCQYEPSEGEWHLYDTVTKERIGRIDFEISRIPGNNHIKDTVKLDGYDLKTYEYEDKLTSGHDTMVIEIRPAKGSSLANYYENWMGLTLGKDNNHLLRPLNEVIIPGSHDSATNDMVGISSKYITLSAASALFAANPALGGIAMAANAILSNDGDAPSEIAEDLSKAQNTTVLTQLNGGIRYFDLRTMAGLDLINGIYEDLSKYTLNMELFPHGAPKLSDDDLYLQHTFIIKDQTALQVVNDAATFAKSHPKEVVILHFQDMVGVKEERTKKFFTTIYNNYKDIIATADKFKPNDPYEKFFGHNLIIIAPDNDGPSWAWQSDKTITSKWPNEGPGNEDKIFKYDDAKLAKRMTDEPSTLFVTQLQSTPNADSVKKHITRSVVMDGYDAKEDEYDYLTGSPYFAKYGNIFIDDVTDPYQEVQLAINLNNHPSRTTFSTLIPGDWSKYCRLANESGEFYKNSYALSRERVLRDKLFLKCGGKAGTPAQGKWITEVVDYPQFAACAENGVDNCITNPTPLSAEFPNGYNTYYPVVYPQATRVLTPVTNNPQVDQDFYHRCININYDSTTGVFSGYCSHDSGNRNVDFSQITTQNMLLFTDAKTGVIAPLALSSDGQLTSYSLSKNSAIFDTDEDRNKIVSVRLGFDSTHLEQDEILKNTARSNPLLYVEAKNSNGQVIENILHPSLTDDTKYIVNTLGIVEPKGLPLNNYVEIGSTRDKFDAMSHNEIDSLAGYPVGNYLKECTDISFNKIPLLNSMTGSYQFTDVLSAKCLESIGSTKLKDTSLNISIQCKPYIAGEKIASFRNVINVVNGELKCAANRTGNDGSNIPQGSYIKTCKLDYLPNNVKYTNGILNVKCSYMGVQKDLSLDYFHKCAIGSSVSYKYISPSNIYLACDEAAAVTQYKK